MDDNDGRTIEGQLLIQSTENLTYDLDEQDLKKLTTHKVRRPEKVVSVTVPDDTAVDDTALMEDEELPQIEGRESLRIQALIAEIGARMGLSIWLPRNDRQAVLRDWRGDTGTVLDRLPLNYDDTTLRTIENIDVLWLRRRSIVRAFEVEHTTSVYSGILRMADLLALQPNMDIKIHIVAPAYKREKVFQEIRRPVFTFLEGGALSEKCTYLSYESIRQLSEEKHLSHLSDSVLEDYAEDVE